MSTEAIVIGRCGRCKADTVQKVVSARKGYYFRCYRCGGRIPRLRPRRKEAGAR